MKLYSSATNSRGKVKFTVYRTGGSNNERNIEKITEFTEV